MTAYREQLAPDAGDRENAVYRRAVEKNFSFFKRMDRLDQVLAAGLSLARSGGYLIPVCELHTGDTALIETFSQWRRENAFAFPTQFPVTDAGTAAWLRSRLLDVPDRLLFLVLDKFGRPVGHLGYANCLNAGGEMEIDNVVRGDKSGRPGIMSEAMEVLLDWAEEKIGPRRIFLRVFHDNEHAIKFYRKLGFEDDAVLPLRAQVRGETTSYVPLSQDDTAPPDQCFLKMVYRPARAAGDRIILTAGPSISAREAWYTLDAVRSGWNHQWNGYLQRFEQSFAEYVGVRYALATSSCTGALHMALLALGIGPGDEVIVPDITWVATANAVHYTGAVPVFARPSWPAGRPAGTSSARPYSCARCPWRPPCPRRGTPS